MTRCKEFYEKVERDGNFCGMSKKAYREMMLYSEEVERDKAEYSVITQGKWLKQRKESNRERKKLEDKQNLKSDITKEPIEGKYNTILIDPPWDYGDNDNERGGTTYNTLTLDELKNIELPTSDNCMLFLWSVDKFYCEAKELMKNWDFTYKITLIWNKEWWGVGYFVRPQHEYLLFGIKGNVKPKASDIPSVFNEKRRAHSDKPEISYKIIEKMSYEPRKEIFGRKEREGWR